MSDHTQGKQRRETYTVNTQGQNVDIARIHGYKSYYANGTTAIEIRAMYKQEAKEQVEKMGLVVLSVFL